MFELLFLLLPIAAAYGWYMGRRSAGHQHKRHASDYSKSYVAGLNYLLSDQPDKAVDQFIALVEVDNETIETHLALGRLFRQRGEVDRSLRVHQNLLARPNLTDHQRDNALYELGNDYLQAGLIDRSLEIFTELSVSKEFGERALHHLVSLYQQTKDWQLAIQTAQKLGQRGNGCLTRALAHFYCELYLEQDSQDISLLKTALSTDPGCVRARLILGKHYLDNNKLADCQLVIDQFLAQDIDYFREAIDLFIQCYHQRNQNEQLVQKFDDALQKGAGIATLLAKLQIMQPKLSQQQLEQTITDHLIQAPSINGFHELMLIQLNDAEEGRAKDSLNHLRVLVGEQLKIRPRYRCKSCGFSARNIHWQCPSCQGWGSIKPIRGLDGD
ncbi:lipopolysaccharide assembly protein LapB [Psychrobium sp. 1_MG-2023]|uniref:lipopolysaccharide assembly protein LapB n=1 Tax=Psychrobium sp. 1_MG-2023 TaxID=3062624 RepID=UPI000C33FFF3|nr:lipopolysaccharide assembly protein LapB [Psychrobium sp. 1_MG-2023]MDP2560333.1 lipopolysaccharide assembly protein LapB [Psychrobium sp. 1_MG-2023]PKF55444.1 lipopolysaccharide assembly protein LapB [Alteromonadales bacterium alter-6D02]